MILKNNLNVNNSVAPKLGPTMNASTAVPSDPTHCKIQQTFSWSRSQHASTIPHLPRKGVLNEASAAALLKDGSEQQKKGEEQQGHPCLLRVEPLCLKGPEAERKAGQVHKDHNYPACSVPSLRGTCKRKAAYGHSSSTLSTTS
jgi:hypothetical protein